APWLTAEELGDAPIRKGLRRRNHLCDRPRRTGLVAVARHPRRGERGVVRPDRAVLVTHRVVMLRPRAPRAYAPAAREVGLAEAARGGAAVRVRCGAGPEPVPGVRNDVGDEALAAVERLRIKGPVRHPERALEFLSDLLGASGELGGPRRVALRDDLGERAHRLDRIRLHLDRRHRALGTLALRVQVAVAGVLPDLVGDPGRSLALELDEEVAVEIAALFHPFERGADVRLAFSDESAFRTPARG